MLCKDFFFLKFAELLSPLFKYQPKNLCGGLMHYFLGSISPNFYRADYSKNEYDRAAIVKCMTNPCVVRHKFVSTPGVSI